MALTSYQASVTSAGAGHVKGSYVQFAAATPYASSRLHLLLSNSGGANFFTLLDIATGGAGSETVVVPNLAYFSDSLNMVGGAVTLEVDIPAGTRLALRTQASLGSTLTNIQILLEDRALGSLTAPANYGADTSTSRGTVVDPGAVGGTKGSYAQLTASTAARIDAIVLSITGTSTGTSFANGLLDLATGAAGAETVIVPNIFWVSSTGGAATWPQPGLMVLPVSIPAGTRIAARASNSITAAGTRTLAVSVIGMQQPASGGGGPTAVAYVG